MSAADTTADRPELARWQRGALLVGAVGVALWALAAAVPATRVAALRGWLVAFNACLGVALGSLVILMLQWVVTGGWGFALRRPLEAAVRTLPVLAALFLPIAADIVLPGVLNRAEHGAKGEQVSAGKPSHGDQPPAKHEGAYYPALYTWSDPWYVAHDEALEHKKPYLNPISVLAQAAVFFGVWITLAVLLTRWSRRQDGTRDPALTPKFAALSAPGMVLYVLTVTFYSVCFVMSLEPHWYSTIYGAMFGMGQVLSAMAFAVVVGLALADRPPLDAPFEGQNRRDLGSLLMAFTMVWAYLELSQFLIIWSGNLPEFVPWYLARLQHGWSYVALALILLNFALPFVLLLSTDVKRDRRRLGGVALLVVVMQVVNQVWLTIPSFTHVRSEEAATQPMLDVALVPVALAGAGGLWLASYLAQLRAAPLLPLFNPWETEGAAHARAAHH